MHAPLDPFWLLLIRRVSFLFDLYLGFPTIRPMRCKFGLILSTISVLGGSLICNPTLIQFAPPGGTFNTKNSPCPTYLQGDLGQHTLIGMASNSMLPISWSLVSSEQVLLDLREFDGDKGCGWQWPRESCLGQTVDCSTRALAFSRWW